MGSINIITFMYMYAIYTFIHYIPRNNKIKLFFLVKFKF